MIRYALALLLLGCVSGPMASAQEWESSARGKVSFTQAGFYRWHDGGVNSLALGAAITGELERKGGQWDQKYSLALAYGLVKQNGLNLRKSEDVIHFDMAFSSPGLQFFGTLVPSVVVDMRSQFAPSFDYSKDEAPRISDFLSPAIFLESIGILSDIIPYSSTTLGISAKQTIVMDEALRARYKVKETRPIRAELGISSLIEVEQELFTNVHLDHRIQFFASFNAPQKLDVFSETEITMTVNQWLQVNLEYVAKLDRDFSRSIQMKELISLAVAFVII